MNTWSNLISAARLRTIPLSLSGTIAGNAIAWYLGVFHWGIFLTNILVVVILQILSNYANDLGDSEHGADNESRIGPARAIQSGIISRKEMMKYIKILVIVSLISGIGLICIGRLLWIERSILFMFGLCAIAAAHGYTRGKFAYGYRGLGDLFVFIFFGLVGVIGSLYLSIHGILNSAWLPAIGVGCLSVAVLHLNNMRDRLSDTAAGKRTMVVRIGRENSRIYFLLLILIGIGSWACFVFTQNDTNLFSYLYWLGFIPLLVILQKFFKIKEDGDFDRLLGPVAMTTFLISILFFISQIL